MVEVKLKQSGLAQLKQAFERISNRTRCCIQHWKRNGNVDVARVTQTLRTFKRSQGIKRMRSIISSKLDAMISQCLDRWSHNRTFTLGLMKGDLEVQFVSEELSLLSEVLFVALFV